MCHLACVLRPSGPTHGRPPLFLSSKSKRHGTHGTRSHHFWAVMRFGGEPSIDRFAKRYELHYQLKKEIIDGFERFQQFGILNFHARQGGGTRLTLAIKNKWSTGWMNAWFYYKVPLHVCSQGGKSMHALRLYMSGLRFRMEPPFDYPSDV
jgi:hypothetical protein